MDMNILKNSTEHHKKRDRREADQQLELEPGSPVGKTVRVEQQQESQQTSEVGKISHNWFHCIR